MVVARRHTTRVKKVFVFLILKKDAGGLFDPQFVQRHGKKLHGTGIFHRCSQTADVDKIGNASLSAGHSAIDVGLDVVGQHYVGVFGIQQAAVGPQ